MNRTVDTQNNVLIEDVLCPELTSVEFSSDLQGVFNNINNNFARLANHEFIKGDTGTSIYLDQVSIYDDNGVISNEVCKKLSVYLASLLGNQSRYINTEIGQLDYYGNFTPESAGKLQIVYNQQGDAINSEDIPVSSLQYVFLDGRFWNDKIGNVDAKYLDGITDLSSIIVYDSTVEGGFKSLNDAFPTMYYEEGTGLCWKLNGKPTGMPVQGVPGKDGKNSLMRIVKVDSLTPSEGLDKSTGEVSYVFENLSGYIPVTNEDVDINDYSDSSAIIIEGSGKIYIGMLSIAKKDITNEETGEVSTIDTLIATCDPNTSLNDVLSSQEIHDAFKKINVNGSLSDPKVLQGLFIPIKEEKDGVQPVHLISASSIINTSDVSSVDAAKNDVIFTPIKNIDDLHPTEENPLNIEKYLYIKLDKEYNKVMSSLDANKKRIGDSLSAYNYCIKYKLIHIAKDKNDEYLNPSDDFTNKDKYNFGYTVNSDGIETLLTKDNVIYKTEDNNTFTDYKDTLPNDLDSCPLYIWERQVNRADYDIDELAGVADYSDVPVQFNYICTRTFTPGISSDIYWFNTLDIIDELDDKYIVRGWSNFDFDMFKIIKFVPVFKDENYHVYDDTAVNFNYNLNITGCDHVGGDSRRNLTVHGDINCDNINVYRLTATGEIDNIYTKQDIVGDSGIMLAKDQEGKYMFEIDSDGNISGKTLDVSGQINASTVISNGLTASVDENGNAGVVQTNSLQIVNKDSEDCMVFDAQNSVSQININKLDTVKLTKAYKLTDDQSYLPDEVNSISKIITDAPVVACNKSSINVTDKSIDNSDSIFLDENITKELYDYFKDEAEKSTGAKNEYYEKIGKGLKDSPNSYAVVKEVLKYKLESSTDFIDTSYSEKVDYLTYSFSDHVNGIYYYNPKPARNQNIKFRVNDASATKTIESDGYVCKFTIQYDSKNKFNPNKPIIITPAKMSFNMGLYTHCDNGTWTYFKNTSWLKFRTIITDKTGKELYNRLSSEEYKFNNGDTQWKDGKTEAGGSVSSENYESWRFKSFEVNPYKITINSQADLKAIGNAYDNDKSDIFIYVYPEFNIDISWKNNKYPKKDRSVADDCKILKFVSAGTSSSNKTISETQFITRKALPVDNTSKISYNLLVNNSLENTNNTVLCKDGLLISSIVKSSTSSESDGYLFGIGVGINYTGINSWMANPEICYGKLESGKVNLKNVPIKTLIEKLVDMN